jgi:hypothetical protein
MKPTNLVKQVRRWGVSKKRRLLHRSISRRAILARYEKLFGQPLDTHNPETFSAKIACRMLAMLNEKIPTASLYADKLRVRDFIANKIGPEYLVKLLWHGSRPKDIPFSSLPVSCVIKTNHACAQVILVDNDLDRHAAIKQLDEWLGVNYYWDSQEFQYYHIKPEIMVEEYLSNNSGHELLDYRFYCFNGIVKVIQVDNHEHSINCFFDPDWNLLDLWYRDGVPRPLLPEPASLPEMLKVAAKLSEDFDFVRVDLYEIDREIVFGELTFTPVGGYMKLNSPAWDLKLGQEWKSPSISAG